MIGAKKLRSEIISEIKSQEGEQGMIEKIKKYRSENENVLGEIF